MLSTNEILEQSRNAFAQSGEKWKEHARRNGELYQKLGKTHKELVFQGAGKTCLCVGFGPSLEDKIDIVKKYWQNPALDIFCVDKAAGYLLKNGIKPKYVNIADAFIDYDRWCKPWVDQTEGITLLSNVTANPEWSHNWRGPIFYYCNKDNIDSHLLFSSISGCNEFIAAGSNVGNSVAIFACSILGYSRYLLLGYDFAWNYKQNYFAGADEAEIGTNKRGWMRHVMLVDNEGNPTQTSQNLMFSSRWMSDYYVKELSYFLIQMFNCSGSGILTGIPQADLERQLKAVKKQPIPPHQKQVIFNSVMKHDVITEKEGEIGLQKIIADNCVANVVVNYITPQQNEWLTAL